MSEKDLQEIKERAEEAKRLLGHGSNTQNLIEYDVPKLVAEVEGLRAEIYELKLELENAGICPHGNLYDDRACISCFGDGTEEIRVCSHCNTETWHRGDKCIRHDPTVPKPNEHIKAELEQLRGKIEAAKKENSASIAEAEERLKSIESSSVAMRDVLEYVRGRLGSVNIGESLHKIDQALSASVVPSSGNYDNETEESDVNGGGLKLDQ